MIHRFLAVIGLLFFLVVPAFAQQGNQVIPAAGGTFSGITPGTNTNVGTFNWSQAGVFTNTKMNETIQSILNSCSTTNVWGRGGAPTYFLTDALNGCVDVPLGSTSGFSNGVAGYAQVDDSGATGALGFGAGVGVFGDGYCAVNKAWCWGMNAVVNDNTGLTIGGTMTGNELDVGVRSTVTSAIGAVAEAFFTVQPATKATAFEVGAGGNGTTGVWILGFSVDNGAVGSTNPFAFDTGKQLTSGASPSNYVHYDAQDHTGAISQNSYLFTRDTFFQFPYPQTAWNNGVATADEGWGIALTSTAALSVNQLVKIDTANSDAVVVCTTADTTACMGFVSMHDPGGVADCAAGNTFCGIIAAPGMFVHGIIGTGTCARGNFVIVDTTTNGDIQCTASAPAARAEIGIAMSACAAACAGTTLDILTKFQ